jgi:hypothetical protein
MLNFSDVISVFLTLAIFIIVDLQTIFSSQYVGVFMICLRIKFRLSVFRDLLVIAKKPKVKDNFRRAAMFLFYTVPLKLRVC